MKLPVVVALLLSTSAMAANQCKPDDICLKIETGSDIHAVPCSGIKSTKFKYSEKYGDEFVIYVDEKYDFNRFARRNYNNGNEVSIYLLNYKFNLKSIYPRLRNNIAINISHEKVYDAANKVKSCVDNLNPIN